MKVAQVEFQLPEPGRPPGGEAAPPGQLREDIEGRWQRTPWRVSAGHPSSKTPATGGEDVDVDSTAGNLKYRGRKALRWTVKVNEGGAGHVLALTSPGHSMSPTW